MTHAGAPASLYGNLQESAERGKRESQRIQALIDAAVSMYDYIRGPGPDTQKKGEVKGEGM